ncbi:hypothetical protein CI238_09034, partial [Colletotrichum incanum]
LNRSSRYRRHPGHGGGVCVMLRSRNKPKVEGSAMDEWAPPVAAAFGSDALPHAWRLRESMREESCGIAGIVGSVVKDILFAI